MKSFDRRSILHFLGLFAASFFFAACNGEEKPTCEGAGELQAKIFQNDQEILDGQTLTQNGGVYSVDVETSGLNLAEPLSVVLRVFRSDQGTEDAIGNIRFECQESGHGLGVMTFTAETRGETRVTMALTDLDGDSAGIDMVLNLE